MQSGPEENGTGNRLLGTSRELTKASQVPVRTGLCWRPAFLEKGFPVLCGHVRQVLARPNGQKILALLEERASRVSVWEWGWLWPVEVAGGGKSHRTSSADRGLGV